MRRMLLYLDLCVSQEMDIDFTFENYLYIWSFRTAETENVIDKANTMCRPSLKATHQITIDDTSNRGLYVHASVYVFNKDR